MLILSHPTGNSNVRHALLALEEAKLLRSFYTTFAWPRSLNRLLPFGRSTLSRRSFPIPFQRIRPHPTRELLRLFMPGRLRPSVDAVYRSLDAALARDLPALHRAKKLRALYCYEDGAAESFLIAKNLGITNFYELPAVHYKTARRIFHDEALLNPAWAGTLSTLHDTDAKLARKDAELTLADQVIVASTYNANSLTGVLAPGQKLNILPYGAPVPGLLPHRPTSGKLRVLYVGALTQRKGLSYLFDAVAPLHNHLSLTLIGRAPVGHCLPLEKAIAPHRHISTLPHAEILEQMRNHDILVFPTLCDGFGLVLTEALSCGLPVIATPNSAAPDLITPGQEGFLVPIRSASAITEKLTWVLKNRTALAAMQEAAYQRAQTLSWHHYEQSLINLLRSYAA